MKKYILPVLLVLSMMGFQSCQSNQSRIDDLKDLVEDIQDNGKDYSAKQWEEASAKFDKLLEKINSYDDLSQEELEEVARLQGQYAATVFKNSGKAIMEQMEKAGAAIDGFIEGISEGLDETEEELKRTIEESRSAFREHLKRSSLLILTPASAVVFFRLMFDKNGWMNGILQAFGMEGQDWLASGNAFAVLIACYIWKNLGYDMVLWMAGLSSIPKEQYEAARVQGAGELQCFLYITLPQLKETAFVTALLSFVNGFRVFREAYLIAGDYPHESIYMLQHLFNNWFTNLDIQKMTAAAVMLVIVTGGVLLGNDICTEHLRRREERTGEFRKRKKAGRNAEISQD